MEQVKLSQSLEDYLEMVHMLRLANGIARVRDIAAALKVKMPSVAKAVIELKKLGLVTQEPYSGIELTSEGAFNAYYGYDDPADNAAGMKEHDIRGLEIDLAGLVLGFGFGRGDNDFADDDGAKVYDIHAAYEFDYAGQHLRPFVDYKSFQTVQHNEFHAGVEAGLNIGGFGFRAVYGFHADYLGDDGDVVDGQDWTSTAHAFLVEPTFEVGMFDIKTTAFYAIVDRGDAAEDASDLDNGEIPEYFFVYAEPAFKLAEFIKLGIPVEYHTNTMDDDDDSAATFDVGARAYITPVENLEIMAFGMVDIPVQDNEDDTALRFGLETVFSF
ncbi:metal-dependent transcriptional regulator [Fibrobacter sp. UBA3718]|uniref:metal-dependent transcriptional regulator n=1 Tax=Fibrobacter sp. UBA3718 TaxID=1946531 RepID=UPI0025C72ABC|nr:metal-dependent transcriptional regulator [Fibrobacter sp. UBA3718]